MRPNLSERFLQCFRIVEILVRQLYCEQSGGGVLVQVWGFPPVLNGPGFHLGVAALRVLAICNKLGSK